MQRLDLYYQIPPRKAGVRLGFDMTAVADQQAHNAMLLQQLGIPADEMLEAGLGWLRDYALHKSRRRRADPNIKAVMTTTVLLHYWKPGIGEMRFLDDDAGTIVLALMSGTSRHEFTLPELPRINVWADAFKAR